MAIVDEHSLDPIKVYVANLGKYNEGNLKGGWITLPASNQQLAEFLKDTVGINERYEEYAIHDVDLSALPAELSNNLNIGEYSNLEYLNMLAYEMENRTNMEQVAIGAYLQNTEAVSGDELLNLVAQADEIPLSSYDYEYANTISNVHFGQTNVQWNSKEKNYAYHALEIYHPELNAALDAADTHGCFDYEEWGRLEAAANYVTLYDEYFYDGSIDGPDLDYYSHEELLERYTYMQDPATIATARELTNKEINHAILKQSPKGEITLVADNMQIEPSYVLTANFDNEAMNYNDGKRFDNLIEAIRAYNKAEMELVYKSPMVSQTQNKTVEVAKDLGVQEEQVHEAPTKPKRRLSPAELGKQATARANAYNAGRDTPVQGMKHNR